MEYIDIKPVDEPIEQIEFLNKLREITVGAGDTIFRTTKNGSWWGSRDKNTAPAVINMDGTASFTSITINGRSGAAIAGAIDANGNFVNQVINDNFNTQTKKILSEFSFQDSGAIAIKTDANNGLWLSPTGLLAKNAGNTTFAIDTSGNATFAGTLTAASGTLGTITSGTITGATIQTKTAGNRVKMSNDDYIYFLTDNTVKGKIYCTANYDLILEGVDDVILKAGGSERVQATSGSFKPISDGVYDLGQSDKRFNKLFVSNIIASSYIKTGGDIYPDTDNAYTLGTSTLRWSKGYFEDIDVDDLEIKASIYPTTDNTITLGSSTLRWAKGYFEDIQVDDLEIRGSIYPNADNTIGLGASDKRWSKGYFEDIEVDDLVIDASIEGAGDKTVNLGAGTKYWANGWCEDWFCDDLIVRGGAYGGIYSNDLAISFDKDNFGDDCKFYASGDHGSLVGKLTNSGNLSIDGTLTEGGADYAEMFESLDGKEIPVGTTVVLEGDKIRPAQEGEQPIGVISNTYTILGNANGADCDTAWRGKYLKDENGNHIYEEADWWQLEEGSLEAKKRKRKGKPITGWCDEEKAPKGAKILKRTRKVINPEFNPKKKYIPRIERPEWNAVGLLGQVKVLKDQPVNSNWILMREDKQFNLYLVR